MKRLQAADQRRPTADGSARFPERNRWKRVNAGVVLAASRRLSHRFLPLAFLQPSSTPVPPSVCDLCLHDVISLITDECSFSLWGGGPAAPGLSADRETKAILSL